ncbi:putative NADH:ubiquinone reductase (H(+)-translocating) (chloroplast) [Rosa chinensis]|uniref:Putative NADH:ubiquinone reductase (H(+)-translocating) n=1 Tax=Rosa chinensis TaxID=74649 RepID=A0A2P6P1D5_ROSCH|nr:putative NADH:ubiquinone reductase (H(+)-translocating) [Rosa chinensis]
MLLAGILLKMGAYGLVRINMELLPHAHSIFSPWLMIVGTIQIIYAALTSPGQRNLKKRIAYSSVSHMGFIIIGIGSISDTGLNGAILQIISHGFIGAALFSWPERVMIEYDLFISTKWAEWLSQFQKYSRLSVSYQWLRLHYRA